MPSLKTAWNRVRFFLLETPSGKTLFSVITTALAGVLSGMFIVEISDATGLNWGGFLAAKSFYGLLLLTGAVYWHNRATFLMERDIARFADSEYCIAFIRSRCLPELAEQYKQQIREGQGAAFEQAMVELKRSLE